MEWSNKLLADLQEELNQKFPNQILESISEDVPAITLKKECILEVIQFLFDSPKYQFRFLTFLTGIHFPEQNLLGVIYQLHNLYSNQRLRLRVYCTVDEPSVPSITKVFEGANWMERETFDFYGIKFEGHPNLKRILNMDDLGYFPMRKEYKLEDGTREDKNDTYFGR